LISLGGDVLSQGFRHKVAEPDTPCGGRRFGLMAQVYWEFLYMEGLQLG
jgi:hypothetical protein